MSEQKYFVCDYCGEAFTSWQARTSHEEDCVSDMFSDEYLVTPEPEKKRELTYRERIELAAQTDPAYQKYVGRIHMGEPNGMTTLLKQLNDKEKHGRGKQKSPWFR